MTDVHTKEQRSYNMSMIRGKWTKQERLVHNFLKGHKVKHKMHPKLPGNPDILIGKNTVVFLDGCFWHGCPKCFNLPSTRPNYWVKKIEENAKRDKRFRKALKAKKFEVINIWEHDLGKNNFFNTFRREFLLRDKRNAFHERSRKGPTRKSGTRIR